MRCVRPKPRAPSAPGSAGGARTGRARRPGGPENSGGPQDSGNRSTGAAGDPPARPRAGAAGATTGPTAGRTTGRSSWPAGPVTAKGLREARRPRKEGAAEKYEFLARVRERGERAAPAEAERVDRPVLVMLAVLGSRWSARPAICAPSRPRRSTCPCRSTQIDADRRRARRAVGHARQGWSAPKGWSAPASSGAKWRGGRAPRARKPRGGRPTPHCPPWPRGSAAGRWASSSASSRPAAPAARPSGAGLIPRARGQFRPPGG